MDNKQIVHNYFLWLILYILNILYLKKLFYSVVIFPDRIFMKKVYCWTKFYILKMQIALIAEEFVNKCDIMTSQNFQSGGGGWIVKSYLAIVGGQHNVRHRLPLLLEWLQ